VSHVVDPVCVWRLLTLSRRVFQVCPRCCLRFCGVPASPHTYGQTVPPRSALCAAVGVETPPTAGTAVCPACLGALQHIDDPLTSGGSAHPLPVLHRAAGLEEGGGPGRCLLAGGLNKAALAAALLCGGHGCDVPDDGPVYTLGVTLDPGFAVLAAAQAAALHLAMIAAPPAASDEAAPAAAHVHVVSLKDVVLAVFRCALDTATSHSGSTVPPLHCHVAILHGAASAEVLAASGCDPLPTGGKPGQRARQQAAWRDEGSQSQWPFLEGSVGDSTGGAAQEQPLPVPNPHVQQQGDDAFNSTSKQVAAMPPAELLQRLPHPFALACAPTRCHVAVCVNRPLLYVGGYYIKQLRGISQTMWMQPPGGGGGGGGAGPEEEESAVQVGNGSVATDIQAVLQPLLRCDAFNFVAAGREDMDVRMLGPRGRPFVLEVDNCRCAPRELSVDALGRVCAALGAAGRVGCTALQTLTQEQRRLIREGEADKRKCYKALVWLSRGVDAAVLTALGEGHKDIALQQRTPIRVLHRRAPLVRTKMVHSLRLSPLPGAPCFHLLHLDCGAGTYVKEFVHGDFGRTQPSLVDLIVAAEQAGARSAGAHPAAVPLPRLQADCIQLDVVSIDMEWV
jgi:hypothetical protein